MKKLFTLSLGIMLGITAVYAQATYTPACTLDLSTAENFSEWTVIDGNPGSSNPQIWRHNASEKCAEISSNSEAANDWIISPAVTLEAGKSYEATVSVKTDSRWDTQKFEVTYGTSNTIEAQSGKILENASTTDISFTDKKALFSVSEAGTYYIGMHCTSGKYNGLMSFQSMKIDVAPETPNPVTNVSLTAEGNTLVLNFTPPTSGINNTVIDLSALKYKIERTSGSVKTVVQEAYSSPLPYREEITELNTYKYSVTAISKTGTPGKVAESETIVAGPAFTVPYEVVFKTASDAALFTTVNANGDGHAWKYSSYDSGFDYWGGPSADDWIVAPKIVLEKGKAYKVAFKAKLNRAGSSSDYKNLAIALSGNGKTFGEHNAEFVVNSTFEEEYSAIVSVQESAETNIGIHVFGAANSNDVFVTSISVTEENIIPESVKDLKAIAAENGKMEVVLNWTNPATTNAATELKSITKYEILRGETVIATKGNPVPGAKETYTDAAVTAAGVQQYTVKVYSGENFAAAEASSTWVGEDTPLAVKDLAVTAEGNTVTVSFNPPAETVNGGWLNLAGMGYKIERNAEVLAEKYTGTLPYIDEVTVLGSYKYKVTPITASGLVGTAAESAAVQAGPAFKVPFEININSPENGELFTLIDANSDGKTWKYYSDTKGFDYWGGTTADDWIVSPKITLEAGKSYKVIFKAWLSSGGSSNYKNIAVATSRDGVTFNEAVQSFQITSTFANDFTTVVSVPETGDWNIGLHVHGQTNYNDVYVNYIAIKENGAKPAAVENLTAAAAENGKLEAVLTWTNPDKDTTGKPLDALTKYEILRGETVIKTVENPVPGAKETCTDAAVPAAGIQKYTLKIYLGGETSTAEAATGWVGEDTPLAVTGLTATAEGNNVSVTFTAPEAGVNGGWINAATMGYKIERNGTVLAERYTETLPFIDAVPELGSYVYKVTPVSESGLAGAAAESNAVVAGPAFEIPYEAVIDSKEKAALFTSVDGNADGRTWGFSSYPTNGMNYWGGNEADDRLLTPKIKLEAGKAYKVTFKAKLERALESDYKDLSVSVSKDGKTFSEPSGACTVQSTFIESFSTVISVPETGEWNVAVNVFGRTSMNGVIITEISVVEEIMSPLAVENLTAKAAANGEMKAVVAWTNPTKTNAGTDIAALTKYEVWSSETVLATVENPVPGAAETYTDAAVSEAGVKEYTVRVYIGEQFADAAASSDWIGEDTPLAVTDVTVSASDATVTLSFTAPAGTVHNGWMDAAALGYKIERNGEVIEECFNGALPYIDEVPGLATYTYTISPVTPSGLVGEAATSASVIAGTSIVPPYEFNFADMNLFGLYTIVDADNNGKTWKYDTFEDAPAIGFDGNADDWIFTPNFYLDKDYDYTLTITAKLDRALNDAYYKTLEFTIGKGTNPEGHTRILGSKQFESALSEEFSVLFWPAESGVQNFGIHCTGTINWTNLYLKNIKVEKTRSTGVDRIGNGSSELYYNTKTQEVCGSEDSVIRVFNINGTEVAGGNGTVSVAGLADGVYIATGINEKYEKTNIKFIK